MDGPWQIGHRTAADYGKLAAEAGKAMKLVDSSIELVVCGSSSRGMATFGQWEAEVLASTYQHVDYISLHAYYEQEDGDLDSFLCSAVDMDAFIEDVIATCDYAKVLHRSSKTLQLSFDEWNVWSQRAYAALPARDWQHAPPLIEDTYSVADAVVVASYLITLLNHADRIGIACQAQLANVIAPIRTETRGSAWRQTIFHPFAQIANNAKGSALHVPAKSGIVRSAEIRRGAERGVRGHLRRRDGPARPVRGQPGQLTTARSAHRPTIDAPLGNRRPAAAQRLRHRRRQFRRPTRSGAAQSW